MKYYGSDQPDDRLKLLGNLPIRNNEPKEICITNCYFGLYDITTLNHYRI